MQTPRVKHDAAKQATVGHELSGQHLTVTSFLLLTLTTQAQP